MKTYTISYLASPSMAVVRDNEQHIIFEVRSGWITAGMISQYEPIIGHIHVKNAGFEHHNSYNKLLIRRIFIDDARGGYVVFIDYIYDRNAQPPHNIEDLKSSLGDNYVNEYGQHCTIEIRVLPENIGSDHFFPVADRYYTQD